MASSKTKCHFLKPGMLTTIQDAGRLDYLEFGVPIGGAMDKTSMRIANWLVGKEYNNPVLEITMMGPTIQFSHACQIALTGADISPSLNGEPIPLYETLNVKADDILKFGRLIRGCRTYFAVAGKWDIGKWLGSYSSVFSGTITKDSFGIIQKESTLSISKIKHKKIRKFPDEWRPIFGTEHEIRVIPGPEFNAFTTEAIAEFFSQSFVMSPNSNRMGCRLKGTPLKFKKDVEMISSGIVPGTIQVTREGLPVILLADAQTSGGYYRIANVVSVDLDRLAQAKPGDTIKLKMESLANAQVLLAEHRAEITRWFQVSS